jgi:hypothetical protein
VGQRLFRLLAVTRRLYLVLEAHPHPPVRAPIVADVDEAVTPSGRGGRGTSYSVGGRGVKRLSMRAAPASRLAHGPSNERVTAAPVGNLATNCSRPVARAHEKNQILEAGVVAHEHDAAEIAVDAV